MLALYEIRVVESAITMPRWALRVFPIECTTPVGEDEGEESDEEEDEESDQSAEKELRSFR